MHLKTCSKYDDIHSQLFEVAVAPTNSQSIHLPRFLPNAESKQSRLLATSQTHSKIEPIYLAKTNVSSRFVCMINHP